MQARNFTTRASNFGGQLARWQGADFSVNAWPRNGLVLFGGVSTGKTMADNCAVARMFRRRSGRDRWSADAARDHVAGVGLLPRRADQELEVHAADPSRDTPAIWLNEETMAKYRPALRRYYYDPTKYKTYLDQLGVKYPTLR